MKGAAGAEAAPGRGDADHAGFGRSRPARESPQRAETSPGAVTFLGGLLAPPGAALCSAPAVRRRAKTGAPSRDERARAPRQASFAIAAARLPSSVEASEG